MLHVEVKIAHIAERQHAVVTGAQAVASGLSQAAIGRRVREGSWTREHSNVYRIRAAPATFEGRAFAAVLAGGPGALASFTTAGRLLQVEVGLDGIHITVPNRRRVRIPGVVVHRPVRVGKKDTTRVGVIPVTSPSRTIIDLAAVLAAPALEDAIDDLRRRALIDVPKLAARVGRMNPAGRRGIVLLRRLLAERVGVAVPGSNRERDVGALLKDAGLPAPVPQYVICDEGGRFVAQVDYAYPEARLVVEFDGYEKHSSRRQWENDLVRQNAVSELGWRFLRISSRQADNAPHRVIDLVSGRLRAAGVIQ
jgi:hypothetical protein